MHERCSRSDRCTPSTGGLSPRCTGAPRCRAPGAAAADRFNFAQHLFERNAGRADKAAYVDDRGALTYGELARARRAAAPPRCSALGVRREERVLLLMHDSDRLAGRASSARCTPASCRWRSTRCSPPTTTPTCCAHSRAQAALVSARAAADAAGRRMAQRPARGAARDRVARRRRRCRRRRDRRSTRCSQRTRRCAAPARDRAPTTPRFWLYSSGSTGRPKGTVHTHANPYWTAELYGRACSACRGRRLLLGRQAVLRLRPRQRADLSAARRRDAWC